MVVGGGGRPRGRWGRGGRLEPPLVDSFDGVEQQEEAEPMVVAVGRGAGRNGGDSEVWPGLGFAMAHRERGRGRRAPGGKVRMGGREGRTRRPHPLAR
jgi:hypothetical protein